VTGSGTSEDPKGKQQTPPAQRNALADNAPFIILIGAMVLMFWWMSRSNKKREEQRQAMIRALKVGDQVITNSGVVAEIAEVCGDEMVLRIDARKDVRMRIKSVMIVGPAGQAASDQALKDQQRQQ